MASAEENSERVVSAAEVAKHACFERGKEDVWLVLDLDKRGQRVFDVTHYLDEHPGGPEILQEVAGLSGWDATDEFVAKNYGTCTTTATTGVAKANTHVLLETIHAIAEITAGTGNPTARRATTVSTRGTMPTV